MKRLFLLLLEIVLATAASAPTLAGIVTFGSGTNTFDINFVEIGSPGNMADTTSFPNPVGKVGYVFGIAKYEISRDMITKANAVGGLGITLGSIHGGNRAAQPATYVSWYEAAKFVNWLNMSKGYQAAYRFDSGGNFQLWDVADSWTDSVRGTNRFRHKDAYFWLPNVDEWYKAAYYNPVGSGSWLDYPTSNGTVPTGVTSGTDPNTAVFRDPSVSVVPAGPADVDQAGGLSAFGVMGLGGNVWEWQETAFDLSNNSVGESRLVRGGYWRSTSFVLRSPVRSYFYPASGNSSIGFRVASSFAVPEPGSFVVWGLLGAGVLVWKGKRRKK